MSGDRRQAQPAGGRPLDGGVRPHALLPNSGHDSRLLGHALENYEQGGQGSCLGTRDHMGVWDGLQRNSVPACSIEAEDADQSCSKEKW